jgi:hypothetical protein
MYILSNECGRRMKDIIIPLQTTARIYVKIKKPEKLEFIDYEEYGKSEAKRTVIGSIKNG